MRDESTAAGSKQSAHFIFSVLFIYFSYHSSCRKDQSTVLILKLIYGPDKKERTKRNEYVGMYNGLKLLILLLSLINSVTGLNIKFYGIFAKQHV